MNPLRLLVLLVSLPLLLGGCGEKEVNFEELEERESITYLKGSDTPYTGKAFTFYENGQKWQEVNYKNGKPDGLWVSWHENGEKRGEGNIKDGKQISKKWWHNKGEPVDTWREAVAE